MAYNGFLPENVINIGKIYSIHYFEYMSDFSFEGESHDFWEFICVDKGEVEVTGGDKKFILHKGEIAFHEPNEFHNVTATGTIAPNLIVISFQCDDNAIYYFRKKILKMDDVERNLLASIIFEARHTFQCRLDDPYLQNMPLKQPPDIFGSQQMIRLLIEQFLIHLARRYSASYTSVVRPKDTMPAAKSTKSKNDIEVYSLVTEYMTAEDIQKSMRTWHHRLFFEAEDQHCKRTDPIQTYEFYTDFRLSWIYLHSLLLKTIQKRNWNDTV